jgi:hypothetical protein
MEILCDIIFILLWILSVIGVYQLIKQSVFIKDDSIKIEIQPPVEINKRLNELSKTVT